MPAVKSLARKIMPEVQSTIDRSIYKQTIIIQVVNKGKIYLYIWSPPVWTIS